MFTLGFARRRFLDERPDTVDDLVRTFGFSDDACESLRGPLDFGWMGGEPTQAGAGIEGYRNGAMSRNAFEGAHDPLGVAMQGATLVPPLSATASLGL
jgi:hypothetical protein